MAYRYGQDINDLKRKFDKDVFIKADKKFEKFKED